MNNIKIGARIDGRYRVLSRIGTGGMAEIFEVHDIINRKTCVLKIILPKLLNDQINIDRFNNEALIESKLNHPNIVRVYGSGVYEDRPYMILEYIKGQTLREKIDFLTTITHIEACEMMLQLCHAVSYIHKRGIIHRDIKPDNIYVMPDGTIKLSDFGISIDKYDEHPKKEKTIVGSVHYLAPEICQSKPASIQSDIYALGVTFFEIVTHRLPFEEGEIVDIAVAHIKEEFPKPSNYTPGLPKPIEDIILRATAKDPLDRYESTDEMIKDLEGIINVKDEYKGKKKGLFARIFGFKEEN